MRALDVVPSDTIIDVKKKIKEKDNINFPLDRLRFTKNLTSEEDKTLSYCNIFKESTLHLVQRQLSCSKYPKHWIYKKFSLKLTPCHTYFFIVNL